MRMMGSEVVEMELKRMKRMKRTWRMKSMKMMEIWRRQR